MTRPRKWQFALETEITPSRSSRSIVELSGAAQQYRRPRPEYCGHVSDSPLVVEKPWQDYLGRLDLADHPGAARAASERNFDSVELGRPISRIR